MRPGPPRKQIPLKYLQEMEEKFAGQGDTDHNYGWSPFPMDKFERLMSLAIQFAQPGALFMEAGCGIGTKLYRAKHEYGLWEYGFDINPGFIAHARMTLGVRAYVGDVRSMHYNMADIVYLSRPYKDDATESAYERQVHDRMRNGAVLIAAWTAVKPPWHIIHRLGQHGVWKKPDDGMSVQRLPVPEVPTSLADYNSMIQRRTPTDPLTREPGPGR